MGTYSFSEHYKLPATVEQAYKQLTDLKFIQDSYAERNEVSVDVQPTAAGHNVIVSRPVGPGVGPLGLQLLLEQRWRAVENDKVADVIYNLKGSPFQIQGEMALNPTANGSTLSAHFLAKVSLPIIGGFLAKQLAKVAQEKVSADFEYQRDALGAALKARS